MNPFGIEKHEKKFIAGYMDTVNDLLEESFKSSQRIKLVCYDVSRHFIVFGAKNGSIHIYRRGANAAFLKLIPSKNSATIKLISISPNEENIVIADEIGIILILENCFLERNFHTRVYTELKGKRITATKWDNENRVYVGDNDGTISVLSVPHIVSLALLHTPYVSLMDLGAPIVQIDVYLRFILVTTERKTFICDTEREMYKQVGRKEKALGACFYNRFQINDLESLEDFSKHKLYCTRPGLRMWQANFEGEVFYTHKYRNAIPNINEIIKFREEKYANLVVEKITKPEGDTECFGKIFLFNEKYLCAISNKSFYIIDPDKNDLVFFYHSSYHIDVRFVENQIYIWNSHIGKLQVFNLYNFEELMSNILRRKQYKMGIQLIVKFKDDIVDWSKRSPNTKLVTNLKSEITSLDPELKESFEEVVQEILDYEKEQLGAYLKEDDPKIGNINDVEESESDSDEELGEELQLMYKQYKLNENNDLILMPHFTDMLLNMNEDDMTQLFLDFIDHLKSLNEDIRMEWCYNQYIHHFHWNKGYAKLKKMKSQTVEFVTKCFLEVNKDLEPGCTCTFPLPCLHKTQPRYDNIGKALSEHIEESAYLFGKIPYLWLHRILKLKKIKDMEENLQLILQFGYVEILKRARKHVTYDFCDNLIGLFLKLKAGNCLNCGKPFNDEHTKQIPDWEYLGLTLIQFIGADNVLKLFLSRHEDIPKDELSEKFYMTCMFSKVQTDCDEGAGVPRGRAVEMASSFMDSSDTKAEFKDRLRAFLISKVNKMFNAQGTTKKLTCSICSYCETVLNHPVLNQMEQLDCGHAFHAICLQYINRVCNVCFCS